MDCNSIENTIIAYIDGELNSAETKAFEDHLASCDSCAAVFEESKVLLGQLSSVPQKEPGSGLRMAFHEMLEEEKRLEGKVRPITNAKAPSWKTAFQIAASLLILIGGFTLGRYSMEQNTNEEISMLKQESEALKENVMMALIDNRSASKRIQAVNYVEEFSMPDQKVLDALIDRMRYDETVNVRMAAAEALSKFSENNIVKDAFIEALTIEKDPGIQIAIIQFLVKVQDKRARGPMQQLLDQNETPNYVKDQVTEGLSSLM